MKTLNLLAMLFVFLGCSFGCSQNDSPKGNTGSSEMTEQAKLETDIALRDETESKMMRGEYLHDGSSILESVGDIESVPALLVVLEKHPPSSKGTMVCTTAHALSALQKLTGANPGITHEAWSHWWKRYKKENKISGRLKTE